MTQPHPEDSLPTPRSDSGPESASAITPIQHLTHDEVQYPSSTQSPQIKDEPKQMNDTLRPVGKHGRSSGSSSEDEEDEREVEGGQKKKHRVTLPRGRACVACRSRKLKCTGDNPCAICAKNNIECRFEEIQRRKPRAVLLEERVAQLEGLLLSKGETLPPTKLKRKLSPSDASPTIQVKRGSEHERTPVSAPQDHPRTPPMTISNRGSSSMPPIHASPSIDIPPHSTLEATLINVILPHTPYLLMPIHPQRFLALLSLPPDDPARPHPALLYIMFADAVQILEKGVPAKILPPPPQAYFPNSFAPLMPPHNPDDAWVLQHVGGMSGAFLERARVELDKGIRNVDRLFDLTRATVGIARRLISEGRFIEGYTMPVSRILISCGLHRQTGVIVPPDGVLDGPGDPMPKPYASPYHYRHANSAMETSSGYPILRMRPVVLPPARDEIEIAERVMTFWAVKYQEWEMSVGWGWSVSLADEECTTMWPWGWGVPEIRSPQLTPSHFGISDLYDPHSPMHTSPVPDATFTLAIKSVALLHRSSNLFDLPIANIPDPSTRRPHYIPSLTAVQSVATALRLFRDRIPVPFQDRLQPLPLSPSESYDGPGDPWWVALHANLLLAEIMMWKEMAHYDKQGYDKAVMCARAMVSLVKRLRSDCYINLPLMVSLDFSLAARFLNKESSRLASIGHQQGAIEAAQEAEVLRAALANDVSKYMPMASLHAMIIQRVKEGWPEKEGEYERV